MSDQNPSLNEAANLFISSLPAEKRGESQQEVNKFIRWFGREQLFEKMRASEVANYAEQVSKSDVDFTRKLSLVRTFLSYGKKKGWSKTNLATHLKASKGKAKTTVARQDTIEPISMTQEGYDKLKEELGSLQEQRLEVIEEVRKAAADKDFRENAPLHAAREKRGMLEGRIMELEAALNAGVVVGEDSKSSHGVDIGNAFVLVDPEKGTEIRYTLVGPQEADPSGGKISSVSPIGKAVMGKAEGDKVEIEAPKGKLRYQLKKVE